MKQTARDLSLALVATALLVVSPARAQDPSATFRGATCGGERMRHVDAAAAAARTAASRPDLYRRVLTERESATNGVFSDPDEATFWVYNPDAQQFEGIQALRFHASPRSRLWIDVRDTHLVGVMSKIPAVVRALDSSTAAISRDSTKGIIQNVSEVFGPLPRRFGDSVVDFLLFDIPEDGVAGFFFPWDLMNEPFSNRRNLLYIDSRDGLLNTNSLLNTIAHEFQHLVHFDLNEDSDTFVNEGCSEVAGLLCGYRDRWNSLFLRNTNFDLFDFPENILARDVAYERAYTLMWYLYEQFGEALLGAIPRIPGFGMALLEEAMARARPGNDSNSWRFVGSAFAVANYLQTGSLPQYSYRRSIVASRQPRAKALRVTAAGQLPSADSVVLEPYGAAYLVYEGPGVFPVRFRGRYSFGAFAVGFRGDSAEILEFMRDRDYVVGEGAGFDRVVMIVTELSNTRQTVAWSMRTAAAADPGVEVQGHDDLTVRPNPTPGRTVIAFRLDTPGPVWLELVDCRGQFIRSIIEGNRWASGEHSTVLDLEDLPAGTYVARLRTSTGVSSRLIPVVH